ncbi:hypothetical protein HII36_29845 [Nonomuraea sp. NN258]|uniref:hypothetical protein n=1 Tax=Nonomuraea antri TaxID=2730852 RepID=UPI001567EE93|nr:hypothetical protein [Nonomuraea antri]NRQ36004.1 hypothetical protein [Nonomuraea antri]
MIPEEQADADRAAVELAERVEEMRQAMIAKFAPVFERMAREARLLGEAFHRLGWGLTPAQARRHRRRCWVCNPRGFPRPLQVDGREYARRRRARVRRRAVRRAARGR